MFPPLGLCVSTLAQVESTASAWRPRKSEKRHRRLPNRLYSFSLAITKWPSKMIFRILFVDSFQSSDNDYLMIWCQCLCICSRRDWRFISLNKNRNSSASFSTGAVGFRGKWRLKNSSLGKWALTRWTC